MPPYDANKDVMASIWMKSKVLVNMFRSVRSAVTICAHYI